MKFRPHHLLRNFLDYIGTDYTDPVAVKQVIARENLRRAVASEDVNYTAKLFFQLLRSHSVRYWEIDTLDAAGKKIRRELRRRHVCIARLAREAGLGRTTIRTVGMRPRVRMATLIAVGRPAGFLNGEFSR